MEVLWCLLVVLSIVGANARPNIILIIADDLGWNDVSFHGSGQVPTPNLDALASAGLPLHAYYVTPLCTPSRAALMTGKYPIHTGMQHNVIYGMEPRGLPLSEKIMPQYLKDLGYKTHLVGKWHLGSYKSEYLPLNRGFDTHVGFWTGRIDMYDHTSVENGSWGFDFRRGFEVAHDLFGKYATDVYTDEAIKVIKSHNASSPLFLTVAHSAVHSGNPAEFIRAPDDLVDRFKHIEDYQRRKFAAVLTKLDESVGQVVAALKTQGLLENSIIMFSTDNGGPAAGFNDNVASNYPLRGVKNTLWEGGVRGVGFLWSPLIKNSSRVATQRMHISDWLPTLYSAAGGDVSVFKNIDGFDLWRALSEDLPSPRKSIVHNIDIAHNDNVYGAASATVDQWKVHQGTNYKGAWDGWYGPSGRDATYDVDAIYTSDAGVAVGTITPLPAKSRVLEMREQMTVNCNNKTRTPCKPLEAPCLFNIEDDPCEHNNLASEQPEVLQKLLDFITEANKTALPPNNKPLQRRGDPKYWGRVYVNFGDYSHGPCL